MERKKKKIPRKKNKEIEEEKKEKNFSILLRESKNHCLAEANIVATTVDEPVR